jgi:hypothetical protein
MSLFGLSGFSGLFSLSGLSGLSGLFGFSGNVIHFINGSATIFFHFVSGLSG